MSLGKHQSITETDDLHKSEDNEAKRPAIPISVGLTSSEAENLLLIHGKNELDDKKTPKWLIFLQQFWAPMPIMIWIAAIVEGAIENFPDFGILLAIQFINAGLGFYEVVKVNK
jgi:H+-transporting ATPase